MATIPLSEIPNAPQGVFTPTADYRFPTDQVGDQAKGEIARGFQGMMQDPRNAGLKYDSQAAIGNATTKTTADIAGTAIEVNSINQQKRQKLSYDSGLIKLTQNETAANDKYNELRSGLPVAQWPSAYVQAYGKDGESLMANLDPMEQKTMIPHAMRSFHTGMQQASTQAFVNQQQEDAAIATQDFSNKLTTAKTPEEVEGLKPLLDAYQSKGNFSKSQVISFQTAIQTRGETLGWVQGLQAENDQFMTGQSKDVQGPTLKRLQDAADKEVGIGNLDAEHVKKLAKSGTAMANDTVWTMAGHYMDQFKSGTLTSVNQLEKDAIFQNMPSDVRNAVYKYVAQPYLGTSQGEINRKDGQSKVDSFPPTDGSDVGKAYYATQIQLMSTVPAPFLDDQLKTLEKKRLEMSENGGNLKPETQIVTDVARGVKAHLMGGTFGPYAATPTDTQEATDSNKAATKAEGIQVQVLSGGKIGHDTYPSGPPSTPKEAADRLDSAMKKYQQGADASSLFNKPAPKHGPIYNWFHGQANNNPVIPIDAVGTTYGYKSDPYMDSNTKMGKGDHENKLVDQSEDGGSVGFSREIKKQITAQGIKKGDPIILHLDDGTTVAALNDDTTDKGLTKRADFYNTRGEKANPYQDRKIVGVQKG
jgi:hypothetical protein